MLSSSSGSMLPVWVLALRAFADNMRIRGLQSFPLTHVHIHSTGHLSPRKGLWQIVWVLHPSDRESWDM